MLAADDARIDEAETLGAVVNSSLSFACPTACKV